MPLERNILDGVNKTRTLAMQDFTGLSHIDAIEARARQYRAEVVAAHLNAGYRLVAGFLRGLLRLAAKAHRA